MSWRGGARAHGRARSLGGAAAAARRTHGQRQECLEPGAHALGRAARLGRDGQPAEELRAKRARKAVQQPALGRRPAQRRVPPVVGAPASRRARRQRGVWVREGEERLVRREERMRVQPYHVEALKGRAALVAALGQLARLSPRLGRRERREVGGRARRDREAARAEQPLRAVQALCGAARVRRGLGRAAAAREVGASAAGAAREDWRSCGGRLG